jgi:hypothetical protein
LEVCGQAPRHPSRGHAWLGLGAGATAPSAPCFSGFSMRLLLALLVRVRVRVRVCVCVIEPVCPGGVRVRHASATPTATPTRSPQGQRLTGVPALDSPWSWLHTWTTGGRVGGRSVGQSLCRCVAVYSLCRNCCAQPPSGARPTPCATLHRGRAEGWLSTERERERGRERASELTSTHLLVSPSPHLNTHRSPPIACLSAFPRTAGRCTVAENLFPPASTRVDVALLHRMTRCCLFGRWLFLGWPST